MESTSLLEGKTEAADSYNEDQGYGSVQASNDGGSESHILVGVRIIIV